MESIKSLVTSVTVLSVFCMICEFLLPQGNVKQSAKNAICVMFVSVITETVITLLGGNVQ